MNPVRREQVVFINIKAHSVVIQWTVAYISYSPEMYLVQYGINMEDLDQNSSSVHSGDDITITSKAYSVVLSGLRDNTTYYVQVLATNTAQRSNTSIVTGFTTLFMMEMKAGNNGRLSIRESVDSPCRDDADMPIPPYIRKACNRPNAAFVSLFRYMTVIHECFST